MVDAVQGRPWQRPNPGGRPAVGWFEIPVEDVDRAVAFYAAVVGCAFTVEEDTGDTYPMFTAADGTVYGALNRAGDYPMGEGTTVSYAPGETGVLVYLTVADVDEALAAVGAGGGEVLVGSHRTPDGATYAIVGDPEGNRIGLIAERADR